MRQPTLHPIKAEQTASLLRAMIAEAALGFERQLNSKGVFEWRGLDPETEKDTGWIGIEDLPKFPDQDHSASEMWRHLCDEQHLVGNINYEPDHPDPGYHWECSFLARHPKTGKLDQICAGRSSTFAFAVCVAITSLYKMDVETYHRLLYPGDYLKIAQPGAQPA